MKKLSVILFLFSCLCSCQTEYQLPGYRFSNFKNTSVENLANAIKDNDTIELINQLKKGVDVNFKDPKYKMSLLCLAIANHKKESFLLLLNNGADFNLICGPYNDYNPFIIAVEFSENCESFYIEELLKRGCKPNKLVYYVDKEKYEKSTLFASILLNSNETKSCIGISKLLLDNGVPLNETEISEFDKREISIVEFCLLNSNLDFLEYLLVEKKVKAPKNAITYGSLVIGDTPPYSLTITETLMQEDYVVSNDDSFEKTKQRILDYLKKTNQK